MPLEFHPQCGYEPAIDAVRFYGYDRNGVVPLDVTREALRCVAGAGEFDERDCTFFANRPEARSFLEKLAARKYERGDLGPDGGVLITRADAEPYRGAVPYERTGVTGFWLGVGPTG